MQERKQFNGRKLKAARESNGLTQQELADHIGVGHRTVWGWEHQRHAPSGENLRAVADVLLVHETDFMSEGVVIGRPRGKHAAWGARLKAVRQGRGFGRATCARLTKIGVGTLRSYEHGSCRPGPAVLARLCEVLGVTPKDLQP
ncbi:MAG: helix-turn-helix domain-containing protein [Actinomycetota bacterium]|nr:helix-turn-helix domain-containing protein [Actinomycetota bacterium]